MASKHLPRGKNSFWRSSGSAGPDSNEHLTYKLTQPLCVIRSVTIQAHKATYQKGRPVYGPKQVQVLVGFGPALENMHYRSPVFLAANHSALQSFSLGRDLVIGSYIRIELIGKHSAQDHDGEYYTAIESVSSYGKPIGTHCCSLHSPCSQSHRHRLLNTWPSSAMNQCVLS
eukprot:TRINITY_DN1315_c0_g1_i5.p1 TRINITY_DN1315_c0_g1~~TRINITY_DN1315_c0_g1_i5.p1  ORF type:complete len:172 (-),score=6.76 TRINITY_DN1315_c0_g1_i5:267-782(-)